MPAFAQTPRPAHAAPGKLSQVQAQAPAAPVLEVRHIEKVYGSRQNVTRALNDVSFTVERGEFLGIMGASGSGKSTLLNCVSTIDAVTSGEVLIGGVDVTRMKPAKLTRFRREQLGFIFQDSNLLDTLTARENIALPLTISRVPAKEVLRRVDEVAGRLGIHEILEKYPYQMSGGQQQRVAGRGPRARDGAHRHHGRRAHRRPRLQKRPPAAREPGDHERAVAGDGAHGHARQLCGELHAPRALYSRRQDLYRAQAR